MQPRSKAEWKVLNLGTPLVTREINSIGLLQTFDTTSVNSILKSRVSRKSAIKGALKLAKLKLASTNKISLTDGTKHDLVNMKFDLSQFKLPQNYVILASQVTTKAEKKTTPLGEKIETGKLTVIFKAYDRTLVELAIANQLNEFGAAISIEVANLDSLPIFDKFEADEFIPITFENLSVLPKKAIIKSKINGSFQDNWQIAELKISATNFKING